MTRVYSFQWVFWIIALCVAVFGFDMVWWQALIVMFIASCSFTVSTISRYRR